MGTALHRQPGRSCRAGSVALGRVVVSGGFCGAGPGCGVGRSWALSRTPESDGSAMPRRMAAGAVHRVHVGGAELRLCFRALVDPRGA